MRKIGLFVFFFMTVCNCFAGTYKDFIKVGGFSDYTLKTIKLDCLDNLLLVGRETHNIEFGDKTYINTYREGNYLIKTDKYGNYLWNHIFSQPSFGVMGICVTTDKDGYVYCATDFRKQIYLDNKKLKYTGDSSNRISLLFKFSPSGVLNWIRPIAGSRDTRVAFLEKDSANHIYLGGISSGDSIIIGAKTITGLGSAYTYIAKFDTSGEVIWVNTIKNLLHANLRDMAVSPLGEVYAGVNSGPSDLFVDTALIPLNDSGYLYIKLDTSGHFSKIHRMCWETGYKNAVKMILRINNAGQPIGAGTFIDTLNFYGNKLQTLKKKSKNVVIFNLDKDLNLLKYAQLGDTGWVGMNDICFDSKNTIYAIGPAGRSSTFGNNVYYTAYDTSNMYIAKFDSAFQISKLHNATSPRGNSLACGTNHQLWAGGDFNYVITIDGKPYYGNSGRTWGFIWNATAFDTMFTPVTSPNPNDLRSGFSLFPNPITNELNIQYNTPNLGNIKLSIQDLLGRTVFEINQPANDKGMLQIGLQELGLQPGIYFCILQSPEGMVSKKFVFGRE